MSPAAARLGVIGAAALVVANMIGTGVFTTSGFALADLGSPSLVLWAWVVGGALALAGALCYGALVRVMPESGGEYHYLTEAFHPLAGFAAGWVSLLAGFTAPIALAAHALQAYLVPAGAVGLEPEWVGTAAIVGAGLLHGLRVERGAMLQTAAVAIKIALLIGFVGYGLTLLPDPGPAPDVPFRPRKFAETLVWISLSYSGWNAAVYLASEVRDPERNVGRALLWGTGVVTALYLGLNAVFVHAAPVETLAGAADIGAVAAFELGGPVLRDAVRAIVALALLTSISAMVMAGPRVYARMAEDGVFPRWFDPDGAVPSRAVALQVGLAVLVLWISTLRELLSYVGFTLSLSSAASVLALLWLRRRQGPDRVPVPGHPWLPLSFVGGTLAIGCFFAFEQPGLFLAAVGTVAAAVPAYFLLRRVST